MQDQYDQSGEISLVDLFNILWKNVIFITALTLIFGLIATLYAIIFIQPNYKSNVTILVQVANTSDGTFDYATAQRLIPSVVDLISQPVILEEVIDELSLSLTPHQIQENLTVTSSTTSYFIKVSYLSSDAVQSKEVLNAIVANTIEHANANIAVLANNIIQTSYATNGLREGTNRLLYIFIGLMLGGIFGVGVVFVMEMFNSTFKHKGQLEVAFGIPVIGVIPQFSQKEVKRHGKN